MEKFVAEAFYLITRHLADARQKIDKVKPDSVMPEDLRSAMHAIMEHIFMVQCTTIGLRFSVKHIEHLCWELKNEITAARFRTALDTIDQTIMYEMQNELFLHVSAKRARLYEQTSPLFGQEVFNAFPSAADDISEAGKCLAMDRGTACVFHLMRVMEVGLKALARRLKIPPLPSWGACLRQIDDQLKLRQIQRPQWFKRNERFFKEAAAHLSTVKNAWRNPTMHMEKTYTPEKAEEIFDSVQPFMRYLATKLRE